MGKNKQWEKNEIWLSHGLDDNLRESLIILWASHVEVTSLVIYHIKWQLFYFHGWQACCVCLILTEVNVREMINMFSLPRILCIENLFNSPPWREEFCAVGPFVTYSLFPLPAICLIHPRKAELGMDFYHREWIRQMIWSEVTSKLSVISGSANTHNLEHWEIKW